MTHFERVKALMDASGLEDRLLTGGGIIPTKDQAKLAALGVGKVFGPGDDLRAIIDYIQSWHGSRTASASSVSCPLHNNNQGGIMDFEFSEEQKMVIEGAKDFAVNTLLPVALEYDEKQEVNLAAIKQLGELGYLGMTVPEEYGGTGLGSIAYVGAMIEFSKVDAGVSVAVSVQNSLVNDAIMLFGTEEQKKTFLPKLTSGEWIGCFSLTEAGRGERPRLAPGDGRPRRRLLRPERDEELHHERRDRRRHHRLLQHGQGRRGPRASRPSS